MMSQNQNQQQQQQQQPPRRRVAFLSFLEAQQNLGWQIYDALLVAPLQERGWAVDERVAWEDVDKINWKDLYDVVVVRSTWNYQDELPKFIEAITKIDSQTVLLNSLQTLKWSAKKTYLLDISTVKMKQTAHACLIIPSIFLHEKKFCLPSSDSSSSSSSSSSSMGSTMMSMMMAKSGMSPQEAAMAATSAAPNSSSSSSSSTSKSSSSSANSQIIPPSLTREEFDLVVSRALSVFETILFKPIVGASSFGCYVVNSNELLAPFVFHEDPAILQLRNGKLTEFPPEVEKRRQQDSTSSSIAFDTKLDFLWSVVVSVANCQYIIQPFLETIKTQGEYSLFYFGERLSHALHKLPQKGDFRVQEEYNAKHRRVPVADLPAALVQAGSRVHNHLPSNPLYMRVDVIPTTRSLIDHAILNNFGLIGAGYDSTSAKFSSSSSSQEQSQQQQQQQQQQQNQNQNQNQNSASAATAASGGGGGGLSSFSSSSSGESSTTTRRYPTQKPNEICYAISEIELVEPSLYFNMCSEGVDNFVAEFCRRHGSIQDDEEMMKFEQYKKENQQDQQQQNQNQNNNNNRASAATAGGATSAASSSSSSSSSAAFASAASAAGGLARDPDAIGK